MDLNASYHSMSSSSSSVDMVTDKNDKIVFIGNFNDHSYDKRRSFLNDIKSKVDIDIIESDKNLTMNQYLNKILSFDSTRQRWGMNFCDKEKCRQH